MSLDKPVVQTLRVVGLEAVCVVENCSASDSPIRRRTRLWSERSFSFHSTTDSNIALPRRNLVLSGAVGNSPNEPLEPKITLINNRRELFKKLRSISISLAKEIKLTLMTPREPLEDVGQQTAGQCRKDEPSQNLALVNSECLPKAIIRLSIHLALVSLCVTKSALDFPERYLISTTGSASPTSTDPRRCAL